MFEDDNGMIPAENSFCSLQHLQLRPFDIDFDERYRDCFWNNLIEPNGLYSNLFDFFHIAIATSLQPTVSRISAHMNKSLPPRVIGKRQAANFHFRENPFELFAKIRDGLKGEMLPERCYFYDGLENLSLVGADVNCIRIGI